MDIYFTDRETDIMQVLWKRGASTVAEVREGLTDELAYTTVLTMLRTLEQKQYVAHEEEGRTHRYYPLVEQQAARKSALKHLTGRLFNGSAELLLTHLVADQRLSSDQISRIRKLLDEKSEKSKGGKS